MKLIRDTTPDGKCKYALVRMDKIRHLPPDEQKKYQDILDQLPANVLEYGEKGSVEECFVIKLKDTLAVRSLDAYISEARNAINSYRGASLSGDQIREMHEYIESLTGLLQRAMQRTDRRLPT